MSTRRAQLGAGALLVLACVVIATCVELLGAPRADRAFVVEARGWANGPLGGAFQLATTVGYVRWLGPLTAVLALVVGLALRRWRAALLLVLATSIASTSTRALKELYERPRPDLRVDELALGFSMPSGHSAASAAFAASVVLAGPSGPWRVAVAVPSVAFAGLVGVSRPVLGAHYPSDVIAGWLLGTGVALLVSGALRGALPRRERLTSPPTG